MKSGKLLRRVFVLADESNIQIIGFYNPHEDFNGFQCPYFLEDDFIRYCNARGCKVIFSKDHDTIILDHDDYYDYEELPIVRKNTLRFGYMYLIDCTGWMWMLDGYEDDLNGKLAEDMAVYDSTI